VWLPFALVNRDIGDDVDTIPGASDSSTGTTGKFELMVILRLQFLKLTS
jgi:hypothetical protein